MKLVEDKGGAVALMIAALIFLGTWPALLNLLERRGRNPVHTYLDYSFTNMLMAVIIAFTLGEIGDPKPGKPNFTTQLSQVDNCDCVPLCSLSMMYNSTCHTAHPFVALAICHTFACTLTALQSKLYINIAPRARITSTACCSTTALQ